MVSIAIVMALCNTNYMMFAITSAIILAFVRF